MNRSDIKKDFEFDHPCKNTCSGWQDGYNKAIEQLASKGVEGAKVKELQYQEIDYQQQLVIEFYY